MTGHLNPALDPCECGRAKRVTPKKGCIQCEAMDRERYRTIRTTDVVRRRLARYDELVSIEELAIATGLQVGQVRDAMTALLDRGEAERVGRSVAAEYRIRRAS
jgi:hypothetical protein